MSQAIRKPANQIETSRLFLRSRDISQTAEIFKLIEDNRLHLRQWMTWEEHTESETDTKEYIEHTNLCWAEGSQFDFSIFEKATTKIIGSISAYDVDWSNRKCLVGFWIAQDYQGKAYISEALQQLETALLDLGIHRISITCDKQNLRSQNVALKNQYKKESLAIDDCLERGKLRDTLKLTKLLNPKIEGAITLNLPEHYSIREVDNKTFFTLVKDPMKQIFTDQQMILDINSILSAEEKLKVEELKHSFTTPLKIYYCLFHDESLAGWSWGYQDTADSFFMVNSAILPRHRGRKLYTRLLETVLDKVKPMGFQKIWSLHSLTNNPIIIAKLKHEFHITAFEANDQFGILIRLTYYTNKDRAKALAFRAGELCPDARIREMFVI